MNNIIECLNELRKYKELNPDFNYDFIFDDEPGFELHEIYNCKNPPVLEDSLVKRDEVFHSFALKHLINELAIVKDTEFVSVGSGRGELEKCFVDSGMHIVCVDPDPNSFSDIITGDGLAPSYAKCEDYIKANPNVIGNVGLMLIWPPPTTDAHFDLDAIGKLYPSVLVILYEKWDDSGAAGSRMLHKWIRSDGLDSYTLITRLVNKKSWSLGTKTFFFEIYTRMEKPLTD